MSINIAEIKRNLKAFDFQNQQAFDVEKVTKKFYERFKTKHGEFLSHIEHMSDEDDRKWYTSIMLNRLMFVYFLQRKRLLSNPSIVQLNGDLNYLQNLLIKAQEQPGTDNFYQFYRHFLYNLFHKGLNQPESEHTAELEKIIGKVPFINGGLFAIHILEQRYPDIQIEDKVFARLFKFFEEFDWSLDVRVENSGKEINPDVLGYIFEKHINQKQMGAYYTKEDITDYISKNTIIPFIFELSLQKYPDAFAADGPVWALLKDNAAGYIYNEMAYGVNEDLPVEIVAGINDITQRVSWNQAADNEVALPTETWREVVARRQHHEEVRTRMVEGKINTINDMITYNLNIAKFARDVIATCAEPGLLLAFYNTIEKVTVLDPTCGSGAFLFAALNILKPLYQACIEHMRTFISYGFAFKPEIRPNIYRSIYRYLPLIYQLCGLTSPYVSCLSEHGLVSEREQQQEASRTNSDAIMSFQEILARVNEHSSQEYFILK